MNPHGSTVACLVLVMAMAPRCAAVIVGGPNGDGLGNASESGLQAYLDSQSRPAFLLWNNLLRVSDSSGIYLGRNATTGQGWVMTATHVTPLSVGTSTITVAGQDYTVRDNRIIEHTDGTGTFNTDFRLYAIGGQSGDPALPALPAVPLLAADVASGDDLILTGRGRRQQLPVEDTTAPYDWDWDTSPTNQPTRQMRWGSNHVEFWAAAAPNLLFLLDEGSPVSKKTMSFASVFDDPVGSGTAYEGQLALLDSGGGAFVRRGGSWQLAGTNYMVDNGTAPGSTASPAGYGAVSLMTHLPTYRGLVDAITGPLVPDTTSPLEDFDGDGISNLLEYALNLDPAVNERVTMQPNTGTRGLPAIRLENIAGADRLTMEFVRRTSTSGSGLTYIPEFSSDLIDWQAMGTESVTAIDARWDRVKITDSLTTSGTPRRFARLRVVLAP
jgi:hypothetical protein